MLLADSMRIVVAVMICVAAVFIAMQFVLLMMCIKRCPTDKMLVVTGMGGRRISFSGAIFVFPVLQSHCEISLSAFNVTYTCADDKEALARVCIPPELSMARKAADHLINLSSQEVEVVVRNILEKYSVADAKQELAHMGIQVLVCESK